MMGEIKRIHFIGVGGAGMNGLAEIFINLGYSVSGSDMKQSENTDRIKSLGGRVFIGHDAKNVRNAQIAVYSNAVPDTNPEVMRAREMKIPVLPRAVMLDEVMRLKYGIAIAGSHGKTTTTSMTARIFEEAKLHPTYIVGGIVKAGGVHAKAGKGKYVIAEACEAFGSFLHLNPVIAAVTNIDNDHMDYYKKMDALKDAFVTFINKVPFYGVSYLNGDDANVQSILDRIHCRRVMFGEGSHNDVRAVNIKAKGFSQSFDIFVSGKKVLNCVIPVPGRHNVANALTACAIALDAGIKPAVIKKAMLKFRNVRRRFDVYHAAGVTIIDDYAHHPVEIEKVLKAARSIAGKNKITAVFQPHLFSRTQQLYKEFAAALSLADSVVVDKIYPAREAPVPGVTSALITDTMKNSGYKDVYQEKSWEEMALRVKSLVKKGHFVVLMGAGTITNFRKELEKELS